MLTAYRRARSATRPHNRAFQFARHRRGRIDEPAPAVFFRDDPFLRNQFSDHWFTIPRHTRDLLDRFPVCGSCLGVDCRLRRIEARRLPQFAVDPQVLKSWRYAAGKYRQALRYGRINIRRRPRLFRDGFGHAGSSSIRKLASARKSPTTRPITMSVQLVRSWREPGESIAIDSRSALLSRPTCGPTSCANFHRCSESALRATRPSRLQPSGLRLRSAGRLRGHRYQSKHDTPARCRQCQMRQCHAARARHRRQAVGRA